MERNEGKPISTSTGTQSLDRAFRLLSLVASVTEPIGISELARRSGLAKSTTARLVSSLRDLGALENVDGGLRIGPLISGMTGRAGSPNLLRHLAHPHLEELVYELEEHATLAVLRGGEILYIDQVSAPTIVDAGDWTGLTHPAHASPSGLLLLNGLPASRLDRLLDDSLVAYTDQTLVDPDELRAELKRIEDDGLAWAQDSFQEGVTGVAAPIVDGNGVTVAAVGVFGPSYRFPGEQEDTIVEALVRTTSEVSALLVA